MKHGTERSHVERQIVPAEAEIVKRISELCANELGLKRIAMALTDGGIATPRRDGKGWAPTEVREILHRELYIGRVVWGRTKRTSKKSRTGIRVAAPSSEW